MDSTLNVISANLAFYGVFKGTPEDTIGKFIYNLGKKQWDIPELRQLLENILPKKNFFENFKVKHDFYGLGTKTMMLNARRLLTKPGKNQMILLAIEDVKD